MDKLEIYPERMEKSERQKEFGAFIQKIRKERLLTIKDVAEKFGVSINFISLIERGIKPPSDKILHKYSTLFGIEEVELYAILDKIPPHIKDTLNEHQGFKELVAELLQTVENPDLRQELYEEVYSVYAEFLKRHNIRKE